jgi:hypothetical protein
MKKFLLLPLIAGVSIPSFALPPLGQPGIDGLVNLGYAGGQIKTNFLAEIDKIDVDLGSKNINSFGSPDEDSLSMGVANFDVGYVFADHKTRLSIANDFSDLIEFDRTTRLSLRHDFDSIGQMRLDLMSPAGLATRVYADPYQINVNRKSTDMETSGVQLIWDDIAGSGFGVEIAGKKRKVDDEFSGDALGLSQSEKDLLDRNGDIYTAEVNYNYKVDAHHTVRPAVEYINRDLDGKAMAQDGVAFSVAHAYVADNLTWLTKVAYTDLSGDKENPIFNDKNGASGFAVSSTVGFPHSIRFLGEWTPNISVNWSNLDSHIDFNDFSMWTVGASLARRF